MRMNRNPASAGVGLVLLVLSVSACVTSIGGDVFNADTYSKARALREVRRYHSAASVSNKKHVFEVARMIEGAHYNIASLVRAAELLSRLGYHTAVILDVARIAAGAPSEREEFTDLVDLSVTMLSTSGSIVRLARRFADVRGVAERRELQMELAELKESADYGSVNEALLRRGLW